MPADPHLQRGLGRSLAEQLSEYTFAGTIATITATYKRRFDYKLEDLGTLKVAVVPGPLGIGPTGDVPQAPRGCDYFSLTYGIAIGMHVGSEAEIEDCEDLCQAIIDAIRSDHFDLGENVDWVDVGQPMPFEPDQLEERNVFLSQIEVTYMVPADKVSAPTPPPPEE
ncbi:MAG: hypothetical protein KGR24_05885 [Planctomycetes bacterium]|nr:hypothetical protein [Planctomycetota bacterium]